MMQQKMFRRNGKNIRIFLQKEIDSYKKKLDYLYQQKRYAQIYRCSIKIKTLEYILEQIEDKEIFELAMREESLT